MADVISEKGALSVPSKSVDLANPADLLKFASTLKKFIVEQGLFIKIKDKNYVEVEGWQFAGAATGVLPVIKKVEQIETLATIPRKNDQGNEIDEIKYRAEVELIRAATGDVVGYGVAICTNREAKKQTFDEYAVASMAQTRAIGKAYRNGFAWLMKIAGYEPTPAEEAEDIKSPPKGELTEDERQRLKDEAADIAQNLENQESAGAESQE